MALYGAWQTGDWSSTSTWATLIQSTISQANPYGYVTATPLYTNTLTALNTSDSWRGAYLPFSAFPANSSFTITLQEYNGSTWSDTTATATAYSYAVNGGTRWGFAKFGTPYTPTTTSTGYYRLKLVKLTGAGNIQLYGTSGTAPSCMIASVSPVSTPGTGYSSYLRLPGVAGNYASTPDSAALSITGDIDIRVRVSLDAWSTANQVLIAKYIGAGSQGSYIFATGASNTLSCSLYNSAGGGAGSTSTAAHSFTAGQAGWVRFTYRVSDRRVQFFTAADSSSMPSSWTQLGTDLTNAMTNIKDSTSPLEIGSVNNGASGGGSGLYNAVGNFYRAQIRNNVLDDGTGIQFDADITTKLFGASSLIEASSNAATVTISGSLSQDGDDVLIAGDMTNVSGTTNPITVTVDTNVTIGSGQNSYGFGGSSSTMFPAISIDSGGRLKASRTASATLLVKQTIVLSYTDGELDYGKTSDRIPSTYKATLMYDTSNNFNPVGIRYSGTMNPAQSYYLSFVGASKAYIKTNYSSGLGTAASPLITSDPVDWSVGDQIVVTPSAGYTTYANTAPTSLTYTDATGYNRRYFTLTFAAAHSFKVGDRIILSGFTPAAYNGTAFTIDEVPSPTTLRIYGFTSTGITANATVMGTVVGHTSKSEYRYIKTKNSTTSYVLCTTAGGAEDALQYSPATTADIYNLSSSVQVTVNKRNQSYMYTFDAGPANTTTPADPTWWILDNCRMDYAGNGVPYNLGILANGYTAGSSSATINNTVFWAPAGTVIYDSATPHSTWNISNVVFAGFQYGMSNAMVTSGYNKTFTNIYAVDISGNFISSTGSSNTYRVLRLWATSPEPNSNPAIVLSGNAFNNLFISAYIQGVNSGTINRGISLNGSLSNKFLNSEFGTVTKHYDTDIYCTSSTLNTMVFENCLFGSTNLITNYLNQFNGSELAFQKYQQTTNKHRWYTNTGSARSTGAGLEDTTVKTAGSLNLVLLPENNTVGFAWEFNVLAPATSLSFINGYLQKNATFGSSIAKVELWLPGSDTSSTADASLTADNTTGTWQAFNIYKLYSGTAPGLSTVRITAISSTAGAYLYVADLFNSVGALNLWNSGKPAKQIAITDFSAVPAAVWGFPDGNTISSTMGRRQIDGSDNASTIATTVWSNTDTYAPGTKGDDLANAGGGTAPTASEIAEAVWDEDITSHTSTSSTGDALAKTKKLAKQTRDIVI